MTSRKIEPPKANPVETLIPWGLVFLSLLTASGAVLRMLAGTEPDILKRIDNTTLLYLIVSGALLLLRKIKAFSFGDVKFEILEKVREKQFLQEAKLDDLGLVLPLLLPEKERKHLINLSKGSTDYKGSSYLRSELRRLRSIGLIAMRKGTVHDMKDDKRFDLKERVELTPLGRRWVTRIGEIEDKGSSPTQP